MDQSAVLDFGLSKKDFHSATDIDRPMRGNTMNVIAEIEDEARKAYIKEGGSHDWNHIIRVRQLCMHIGSKENADLEVLELAAILHDIGRRQQDATKGSSCHAKVGAMIARELLVKYHLEEGVVDKVVNCIESHRFRGQRKPKSKEAQVLFDADKLDSIGAIGIGRAFLFAGQIGAKLHNNKAINVRTTKPYTKEDTAYREFIVKLSKIKNRVFTDEGMRIAEDRHNYMVNFFDRLQKEVDGEL